MQYTARELRSPTEVFHARSESDHDLVLVPSALVLGADGDVGVLGHGRQQLQDLAALAGQPLQLRPQRPHALLQLLLLVHHVLELKLEGRFGII